MIYPADILQLATTTVSKISSRMEASPTLGAAATEVIAEALMAMLEKAARICDAESLKAVGKASKAEMSGAAEYWHAHSVGAEICAAAIRSGEQQ